MPQMAKELSYAPEDILLQAILGIQRIPQREDRLYEPYMAFRYLLQRKFVLKLPTGGRG